MSERALIDRRVVLQAGATTLLLSAATRAAPAAAHPAAADKRKIGIIGSGHIGGAVGTLWVKAGHPVMFSSRHPEELKGLVKSLGPLAKAGTVKEAAAFGDIVFIAVPYSALPAIGRDNQAEFAGKVVIDASNAIPARDGAIVAEAKADGVGATSKKYLPGTHLARAFNPVNYKIVADDAGRRGRPALGMPISSDDPEAIKVATELVREAGFDPVLVPLARAADVSPGGVLAGQTMTAPELRKKLGLPS